MAGDEHIDDELNDPEERDFRIPLHHLPRFRGPRLREELQEAIEEGADLPDTQQAEHLQPHEVVVQEVQRRAGNQVWKEQRPQIAASDHPAVVHYLDVFVIRHKERQHNVREVTHVQRQLEVVQGRHLLVTVEADAVGRDHCEVAD